MPRFDGQCHCGQVTFTVHTDDLTALECNCSICRMKGFVHIIVPRDQFTLHTGAEALTTYTFNTGVAQHTFCSRCGVQAFYTPRSHPDGVSVNLRSLDPDEAARFTVAPFDGANWEANVESIQ